MANAGAAEPSARALQGARTRERILEAARRLLAEEGAERFTTRRVAERAGVSHGMCHYHFRDKRDLVLALLVHARRDWIEPLEELVDGPGAPDARMRAVISWMAEPATEEAIRVHTAIRAAALVDAGVRERYAAEYARWRAPFVKLFREIGADRGLNGFDAKSIGEAFAAAADGLVEQQAIDPTLPTAKMLTRLYEQAVGGRRPRARQPSRSR